jgi:hypothetical protein
MGKALMVMNAYDRYRIQFDISFWREIWEEDLEQLYLESRKGGTHEEYEKHEVKKTTPKTKKHTAKSKKTSTHKKTTTHKSKSKAKKSKKK